MVVFVQMELVLNLISRHGAVNVAIKQVMTLLYAQLLRRLRRRSLPSVPLLMVRGDVHPDGARL